MLARTRSKMSNSIERSLGRWDPGVPSEAICHGFPTTGTNLLHMATAANMTDITERLAAKDRAVMEVDDIGDAAMHSAAQYGHIPGDEILLKNCAYCDAKSRTGKSPLVVTAIRGQVSFVAWLLDKGVNVNTTAGDTVNALQAASSNRNTEMAKADFNTRVVSTEMPFRPSRTGVSLSY